jgi:hypothetical protein
MIGKWDRAGNWPVIALENAMRNPRDFAVFEIREGLFYPGGKRHGI